MPIGTNGGPTTGYTGPTPVKYSGSPDQVNSAVLQRYDDIYRENYVPQQNELIGALNDQSIVEDARQNADTTFDRNANTSRRDMRRLGLQMTPLQKQQYDRRRSISKTLNYDKSINDANLAQKDKNISLRNGLINVGRDIQGAGLEGLGEAGLRAANRDASYKVAKAQASAQKTQAITSIATTAAMAFFL